MAADVESWTLQTERMFEAELANLEDDKVRFKLRTGKEVSLPITQLVWADQTRIRRAFPALAPAAIMKHPEARFVRVEIPGANKTLELAEVEVYCNRVNVAHFAKATQSCKNGDGEARLAIDGRTDGSDAKRSMSMTNRSSDPWWELDLGKEMEIERISIHGRAERSHLNGFSLQLLDAERKTLWSALKQPVPKPSIDFKLPVYTNEVTLSDVENPYRDIGTAMRFWTAKNGQQIEAYPVKINDRAVFLKTADDRVIPVPHRNLYRDDIRYVEQLSDGIVGSVVRIEVPNLNTTLAVAEIEIYSGGSNVATKASKVTMTGVRDTDPQLRLMTDGNVDGNVRNGTVCQASAPAFGPAVEFTFSTPLRIEQVGVWGTSPNVVGLVNFSVKVLDAQAKTLFEKALLPAPDPATWVRIEPKDLEIDRTFRGRLVAPTPRQWQPQVGAPIQATFTGRNGPMVRLRSNTILDLPLRHFSASDRAYVLRQAPPPESDGQIIDVMPEFTRRSYAFQSMALRVWLPEEKVRVKGLLLFIDELAGTSSERRFGMKCWREFARVHNFAMANCKITGTLNTYQELLLANSLDKKRKENDSPFAVARGESAMPIPADILTEALHAAATEARGSGLERAPLFIWGRGFGADLAIHYSRSQRGRVKAIALENPHGPTELTPSIPTLAVASAGWKTQAALEELATKTRKRSGRLALAQFNAGILRSLETDAKLLNWFEAVALPKNPAIKAVAVQRSSKKLIPWNEKFNLNPDVDWYPDRESAEAWGASVP